METQRGSRGDMGFKGFRGDMGFGGLRKDPSLPLKPLHPIKPLKPFLGVVKLRQPGYLAKMFFRRSP